jgi:hypothetical protein
VCLRISGERYEIQDDFAASIIVNHRPQEEKVSFPHLLESITLQFGSPEPPVLSNFPKPAYLGVLRAGKETSAIHLDTAIIHSLRIQQPDGNFSVDIHGPLLARGRWPVHGKPSKIGTGQPSNANDFLIGQSLSCGEQSGFLFSPV